MGGPLEFFLHFDSHLGEMITAYGPWIYGILFAIVFCETGLVIFPFLPGDSLLFAAGIFSRPGDARLDPWLLSGIFISAAFLGDNLNYQLGRIFGQKLFKNEKSRIFRRSHLDKTHEFYEKYGPKAVILARFVPFVRTFSPFVAGMGSMSFGRFLGFSVLGSVLWVLAFVWTGHLFGSIPFVRERFPLIALGIVAISVVPVAIEFVRHRLRNRAKRQAA